MNTLPYLMRDSVNLEMGKLPWVIWVHNEITGSWVEKESRSEWEKVVAEAEIRMMLP